MSDFNINEFLEGPKEVNKIDQIYSGELHSPNKNFVFGGLSEFLEDESEVLGGDVFAPNKNSIFGGAISKRDSTNDKLIPNVISECSLVKVFKTDPTNRKDNMICFEDETVEKLKQHIIDDSQSNKGGSNISNHPEPIKPVDVIEAAKSKYGCNTQSCVLHQAAKSGVISAQEAAKEFMENFKIKGPTNSDLLSNFNIDNTLKQWQLLFKDFYAYEFNMVDFKEHGKSLATTRIKEDIYDKCYRTFACVINSDVYSGEGKHWMALFGDMRCDLGRDLGSNSESKWSVEFFNSAGSPPQKSFAGWLLETCDAMKQIAAEKYNAQTGERVEVIKVSDVMHQYSRTECGVYSLYYIWARLHGIPPEYFKRKDDLVSDILCFEFRQHLFEDARRKRMKEFNYDKFAEFGGVKWETDIPKAKISYEIEKARGGTKSHFGSSRRKCPIKYGGSSVVNAKNNKNAKNNENVKNNENMTPTETIDVKSHISANVYEEVKKEIFDEILVTEEEKAQYKKPVPFNMQLVDSVPYIPYRRINNELKLSLHWGQRKLLMTEIFFLAKFSALSKTVLYAGSAPGTHIPFLLEIFPKHKFILYDPRDFSPKLRPFEKSGRVEIYQEYMTDDVARKFQNQDILFVSDIRTDPTEKGVHADMLMQQRWHAIMNPLVSMFKFRLPYTAINEAENDENEKTSKGYQGDINKYPYLDGEIFIQPWAPVTSTETRLLAYRFEKGGSPPMREYNSALYEAQMFRHSLITRQLQNFKHCVCGEGIDYCWDCRAEIEILAMFLTSQQFPNDPKKVTNISEDFIAKNAKIIAGLSRRISKIISPEATLITPPHGIYKEMQPDDRVVNLFVKYRSLIIARKELRVAWSFQQRVQSRKVGLISRAEEATTRVFLMRHGETDNNVKNILHGSSLDPALNLPLNRRGRSQASEIGKVFSGVTFSAIYSSPSARTIETAEIVLGENLAAAGFGSNHAARANVTVVDKLHDLDVGSLEGKTKKEAVEIMKSRGFDYEKIKNDMTIEIPKDLMNESYAAYNKRICGIIEELVAKNENKTILIVGHARMRVFINYLRGATNAEGLQELGNAEVISFIIHGDVKKTFDMIRGGKTVTNIDILNPLRPITYKLFC